MIVVLLSLPDSISEFEVFPSQMLVQFHISPPIWFVDCVNKKIIIRVNSQFTWIALTYTCWSIAWIENAVHLLGYCCSDFCLVDRFRRAQFCLGLTLSSLFFSWFYFSWSIRLFNYAGQHMWSRLNWGLPWLIIKFDLIFFLKKNIRNCSSSLL